MRKIIILVLLISASCGTKTDKEINADVEVEKSQGGEKRLFCIRGTYEEGNSIIPISECYHSEEKCLRSTESIAKRQWSYKDSCKHQERTWCYAVYSFTDAIPYGYLNCYSDQESCRIQNNTRLSDAASAQIVSEGCAEVSEKSFIRYKLNQKRITGSHDVSDKCLESYHELGRWASFPPEPDWRNRCFTTESGFLTLNQVFNWEKACFSEKKLKNKYYESLTQQLRFLALGMEDNCTEGKEFLKCEKQLVECSNRSVRYTDDRPKHCADALLECKRKIYGRSTTIRPTVYGLIDNISESLKN